MKPVTNWYKIGLFVGIMGILVYLLPSRTAFSAAIAWQDQATVAGPTIKLGDLADLSGNDPSRIAVLRAVNMGQAPAPGQTSYLTGDILLARITAAGVNPLAEGWTIPDKIAVTTLSQTVPRVIIEQKILKALSEKVPYPPEDVTQNIRSGLTDLQVPVGAYVINVKFPNGVRFVGPTQATAEIWVDGRLVKTIYLVCDVQVMVQAFVVNKTVAPHRYITPADITVEKRSLASLPVRALKDDTAIKSYWTRRTLQPGTVLTEDMLDIPPVIKRNGQVTITIDTGAVFITAVGLALQDGRPGDVIRVQNVETKRIIMAKVQATGIVVPLGW